MLLPSITNLTDQLIAADMVEEMGNPVYAEAMRHASTHFEILVQPWILGSWSWSRSRSRSRSGSGSGSG